MKRAILITILVAVAACSSVATPDGSTIFTKSFVPSKVGESSEKSVSVVLDGDEQFDDTKLDITLTSVAASDGLHLAKTAVVVKDSGGWQVSKSGEGSPVNVGTKEAPVMAYPIVVSRYRKSGCGEYTRQASIQLRADGTFELK